LLESALPVFAERGLDASIDDIILAAEVSRGTFYNYFRTSEEVLAALGDALAKELVALVESATTAVYEDPVLWVGVGTRLFLKVAREHERFGAFLWRTAFHAEGTVKMLEARLPRDIAAGKAAGRFTIDDATAGFHVVAGIVLAGIFAMSTTKVGRVYPDQLVRSALLGLGASKKDIDHVLALPLPRLTFPANSLLARTQTKGAAT